MRIIIVCYPTFGGSGVLATELGHNLANRGHSIHFIAYEKPVRLVENNKSIFFHKVNVPFYPLFNFQPYELALSTKIVDVASNNKIDLIHVHYAIPHAYAAYMSKKMLEDDGISLPMVTTLHGTDITLVGSHPFYKRAVQFSINNSEYVTAVSKSLKEDTERLFDVEKPIKVIPNFIDLSKTNDTGKTIDKYVVASKDQFVITHISNFRPLKRIIDVLKVFEKIRNKLDAKLIMVGDGPEKLRAKSYCKSNKLDEDVLFLGNSNEVDQILSFSDLFLLPSEQESFGLVALEAMIHKVPVVSTDIGGLPEVIKNGYSGYLCPVGDINLMADQAVFILEDSDRHERFKNQALESCKKFDINNVVIHYEELYGKAIKN